MHTYYIPLYYLSQYHLWIIPICQTIIFSIIEQEKRWDFQFYKKSASCMESPIQLANFYKYHYFLGRTTFPITLKIHG